jgi:hypothetical protein
MPQNIVGCKNIATGRNLEDDAQKAGQLPNRISYPL